MKTTAHKKLVTVGEPKADGMYEFHKQVIDALCKQPFQCINCGQVVDFSVASEFHRSGKCRDERRISN